MKNGLARHGLEKWFCETFDENEKKILFDSCPLFLDEKEENYTSDARFLADTLPWFNKKDNVVISMKVVIHTIALINKEKSFKVLDLHFIYSHLIDSLYRNRDFEGAFTLCVDICNRQIEIAPQAAIEFKKDSPYMPSHKGFEQLAIIEKKNKNWSRVIELCNQAKQEGWAGDWDKRIAEAEKSLAKKIDT